MHGILIIGQKLNSSNKFKCVEVKINRMVIKINKALAFTLVSVLSAFQFVEAADLVFTDWEQARFNELDINNDNGLDKEEFRGTTRDWMTKAGYNEEKQIINTNKKLNNVDTNNDNVVSLEEFVTANRASSAANKAAKVEKAEKTARTNQSITPTHVDPNSKLKIGDIAPNYLGTDREGNKVNVDELNGKVVVVSFWVSWCQHCKEELAILQNLQDKVGGDFLKVVAINYKESHRSYSELKKQLSALNLTLTHDKRGKISKNYGVKKAPHLFIIDKSGKIAFMDSQYKKTPTKAIVSVVKQELSK
jgi:peroxiredoxin